MLTKLFKRKHAESIFWEWFIKKQDKYFSFETNQEELFAELNKRLKKVNEGLTFEFSPVLDSGKRELIISADGIKKTFPFVEQLVSSAPSFEKWEIIAFRQPHPNFSQIQIGETLLDFSDVYFRHAKDDEKIAIELHIRNYKETNEFGMAVFIMLDTLIGEYDTEMMLGYIDKKALNDSLLNELDPITDLSEVIEDHKKRLFGSAI